MPYISVIIPVHNTAAYLKKCVDSVQAQTLSDIEIILAENLSSDGSAEMCDEIAANDSRIKVLHLNVAGLSHARNSALKLASSPYIGYVDSDDYIDRNMYEDMYNAAIKYDADVVYCNFRRISPETPAPEESGNGSITVRQPADVVVDIFMENVSSSACTKIFRRRLVENNPFPEGKYFEDHAVVYKMVGESSRCVHIDRDYYAYIFREGSICNAPSHIKELDFFSAEYGRINYLDRFPSIDTGTKEQVFRMQVLRCFIHLKKILKMKNPSEHMGEILEIRDKLLALEPEKHRMKMKFRYRLFRMKYLWPLFYLTHSLKIGHETT